MKEISPKLEARMDYHHHEREGGEADPSHLGAISGHQTHKPPNPRLSDTVVPIAITLAIHAMIGGLMHAGYEPRPPAKGNLGTVLQQWEDAEAHNADIHERLKQHIEALVDQWINQYMDPSHKDYLGNRSSPESTIIPPEVYLHIDALRQVEHMVENRRFGDEWEWEDVLEKVATLKAGAMALHEESIKIVLDDTTLTWTCDPLTDFPTYQRGAFVGPNRYFYAKGVPNTDYHPDYWELSSQLLDGAVDCQVARSTAMLIREVYGKNCPESMDAMNGFRTIGWKDHVHSGYVTPTGQIHTLREGALTHPVVKGTHPEGAIDPGLVLPLSEHLAIYLEESDLANEPQSQRIRALGLRPDNMGRYSNQPVPPGFRTFARYEATMEGTAPDDSSDKPRMPEPEGNELSFKETLIGIGMLYIKVMLATSHHFQSAGISSVEWPALMSDEGFLWETLKMDDELIPEWVDKVDPRLYQKVVIPWHRELKKYYEEKNGPKPRSYLLEIMLLGDNFGPVTQRFFLDQYAEDPQFVDEWQAEFDLIEQYKGMDAYSSARHSYAFGSDYLTRYTGDERYRARVYTMTGEEPMDELSVREIESASDEAINRLADHLMAEGFTGFYRNPQGSSLLKRLPGEVRYKFLVLIWEKLILAERFWISEMHEFVVAYPHKRDEMVQLIWEKLIQSDDGVTYTELESLTQWAKKYPSLKTPDGVNVFEKCKAECIFKETPFERAWYLKDADDVPLETMEDFRRLMGPLVMVYEDGSTEDIYTKETFETPNPVLREKIRKLYRRTADPRERIEILSMNPLRNAKNPFVPLRDVYPEDKILLARYSIMEDEWGPGKARMIYAPETITLEEWREYFDDKNDLRIGIAGAMSRNFILDVKTMAHLNPRAFEQLVMAVIEDEAR